MDNFKSKFLEEAADHIQDLEESVLLLDKSPDDPALLEQIFRAMHSLKGGGAMFGFENVSEFTHHLETLCDLVRNGQIRVNKNVLNILLAAVDHLKNLLNNEDALSENIMPVHQDIIKAVVRIIESTGGNSANNEQSQEEKTGSDKKNMATYYIYFHPNEDIFDNGTNPLYLIDELFQMGKCMVYPFMNKVPGIDELNTEKCYTFWNIYLATGKDINAITDVFIFVEDDCILEITKLADTNLVENDKFIERIDEDYFYNRSIEPAELQNFVSRFAKEEVKEETLTYKGSSFESKENTISSIRVSSEKLDELMNLVSELVTTQARLSLYAETRHNAELVNIAENVQKLTRQLRDNAFNISLVPLQNIITRFQRLVRDLSGEMGKDIRFITEGTDTELDKTIIENLTDPIMHILRNCIDHGIEDKETREKLNKPEQGTIVLKAFYSGANVHIQIKDDGRGIDLEKIKDKAVMKGLIGQDDILTQKELYDLLFLPGFSTSNKVTDVSGRGVGMDVVRRKILDIRGEVEIESEKDQGTTITVKLPLTLSIIDGLLVEIQNNNYIIPLSVVDKIYPVKHEELYKSFYNLVVLDGEQIPFYNLRNEFGIQEKPPENEQIIVVSYEDKRIGLVVDKVVGEYQAVLKALGKHYKEVEIISGSTILGDGTVALVMDTNKIVNKFAGQTIKNKQEQEKPAEIINTN